MKKIDQINQWQQRKYKCKELQKLSEILTNLDIRWIDNSEDFGDDLQKDLNLKCGHGIERIFWILNGKRWSAVNGFGTYGGYLADPEKNKGLIELKIGDADLEGYLTAADVIVRMNMKQ